MNSHKKDQSVDKQTALISFDSQLGNTVVLEGIAGDAKEGAALEGNTFVVFIEALESWPPELSGQRIQATGILIKISNPPPPTHPEVPHAGSFGNRYLLRGATWKRL